MRNRGSIQAATHPYLRLSFWIEPKNQFWNHVKDGLSHTQKSKEYQEERISKMLSEVRNTAIL